jgi:hypothetical protein
MLYINDLKVNFVTLVFFLIDNGRLVIKIILKKC